MSSVLDGTDYERFLRYPGRNNQKEKEHLSLEFKDRTMLSQVGREETIME